MSKHSKTIGTISPWTDEEYGFVQDSDLTARQIADQLGRPLSSVHQVRRKLRAGWVPAGNTWTEAEESVLISNPDAPIAELERLLPGRKRWSILERRRELRGRGHAIPKLGKNSSPFKPGDRPLLAQTCTACGRLLPSSWFEKDKRKGCLTKKCLHCKRADHKAKGYGKGEREKWNAVWRERHKRWQDMTREQAENNGQPWMEHDMEILSNPELTILQKAFNLKRTYSATQQAAHKFALPSKTPGLGDPEMEMWVIDNPNAEKVDEISELLRASAPDGPVRPEFEWED